MELGLVSLLSDFQAVWNWDDEAWHADDGPPSVRPGAARLEGKTRREVRGERESEDMSPPPP